MVCEKKQREESLSQPAKYRNTLSDHLKNIMLHGKTISICMFLSEHILQHK